MEKEYKNKALHGPQIDEAETKPIVEQEEKLKQAQPSFQFKNLSANPKRYQHFDIDNLPKQAFAGFWPRAMAYVIDVFFTRILANTLYNLTLFRLFSTQLADHWIIDGLNLVILLLYFYLMTYYFNGQSLGKIVFSIRVIRRDGQTIDQKTCLVREVFGRIILTIIPFIACFLVFDPRRQHLVDSWCDTLVIDEKQLEMLDQFSA